MSKTSRFLGIAVALLLMVGCNRYPTITSRDTSDLLKKCYTACNTENKNRLAEVKAEIEKCEKENSLTAAELRAFKSIIDKGEAGEWKTAATESLQFAKAQLR